MPTASETVHHQESTSFFIIFFSYNNIKYWQSEQEEFLMKETISPPLLKEYGIWAPTETKFEIITEKAKKKL